MDWLWNVDMYNAHYYSFWGGSWNSFWQDGQNAITPFVSFHKKAFVLWSLGFVLFPLSVYGFRVFFKKHPKEGLILATYAISAFLLYLVYGAKSAHYSAMRLTYIAPIAVVYAFGIAGASSNKRLRLLLLVLLLVQYAVMVSHFWIQPWWHVTS